MSADSRAALKEFHAGADPEVMVAEVGKDLAKLDHKAAKSRRDPTLRQPRPFVIPICPTTGKPWAVWYVRAAVLKAVHDMSWQKIADELGRPYVTVRNWPYTLTGFNALLDWARDLGYQSEVMSAAMGRLQTNLRAKPRDSAEFVEQNRLAVSVLRGSNLGDRLTAGVEEEVKFETTKWSRRLGKIAEEEQDPG